MVHDENEKGGCFGPALALEDETNNTRDLTVDTDGKRTPVSGNVRYNL